MTDHPSIVDHLLIWIFGIIFPFLSGLQSDKLNGGIRFDAVTRKKLYLGNSMVLAMAGSAVLASWFWQNRPWSTMGFVNPVIKDHFILVAAGLLLFLLYTADLIYSSKSNQEPEEAWFEKSSFLPQSTRELPFYVLLCICAGFFEEIIYRGFMVSYFLEQPYASVPWLALIAPAFLFSLAHFYQGWSAVMKIMILAVLLNIIYLYSRSIYPTMIIHFLIDLISGIAGMRKTKAQ